MATLTLPEEKYIEFYGPTPVYTPAGGWNNGVPDKLVKTHCCFCGVQCGIQLKVKDNKVIGFEPWDEFPVNQGKLCPKGVKRYMQNDHPDICSRRSFAVRAASAWRAGMRRCTRPRTPSRISKPNTAKTRSLSSAAPR